MQALPRVASGKVNKVALRELRALRACKESNACSKLSQSQGRVAPSLTLCRPPVNAISEEWGDRLLALLDELDARDDWTVLHLRSNQKVFAAGADLAQIESWIERPRPTPCCRAYIKRLQAVLRRLEGLSRITLAEIGGAALGGGLELALACDLRIAAHEAKLGLPEVGIGLIPGLGGTQRLTRLAGRGVAARMILTAEPVDGASALALGIVQWAVPARRARRPRRAHRRSASPRCRCPRCAWPRS